MLAAETHGRFGYLKARPQFIEGDDNVHEESLLLIGTTRNDSGNLLGYLRQQGQRFGQDRFVFKPYDDETAYLLGVSAAFPARHEMQNLGPWHPNRMAEYHALLLTNKGFPCETQHLSGEAYFRFLTPRSFFSRVEAEF
ncbi:hypothetical protein EN943_07485 [Mesorhizobium sp. M7A.F.Ca.US.006.01.1.1]|uniref:hypothetical protein n=1 Tax=Mesorhizobium sp. M7A.F.Ca.US.006.01.1.1 TaxID=2496707 RepID=UPI000FCC7F1F|nr:hypothetical protein [Mesorhizobium sp. M7A.F.Ca.US.006.01.1.1]RUZ79407.1 hypothetical protein EN943_07485 [Mesorhizobium sp. M7A.F.Ca.US.006.01.1.1]